MGSLVFFFDIYFLFLITVAHNYCSDHEFAGFVEMPRTKRNDNLSFFNKLAKPVSFACSAYFTAPNQYAFNRLVSATMAQRAPPLVGTRAADFSSGNRLSPADFDIIPFDVWKAQGKDDSVDCHAAMRAAGLGLPQQHQLTGAFGSAAAPSTNTSTSGTSSSSIGGGNGNGNGNVSGNKRSRSSSAEGEGAGAKEGSEAKRPKANNCSIM